MFTVRARVLVIVVGIAGVVLSGCAGTAVAGGAHASAVRATKAAPGVSGGTGTEPATATDRGIGSVAVAGPGSDPGAGEQPGSGPGTPQGAGNPPAAPPAAPPAPPAAPPAAPPVRPAPPAVPAPAIASFRVVTQPSCPVKGTPDAPFSSPGNGVTIAWKVTGASGAALAVDNPGLYGAYGSDYPASGQLQLSFSCGDSGSTTTHTYTVWPAGAKGVSKTLTVSAHAD